MEQRFIERAYASRPVILSKTILAAEIAAAAPSGVNPMTIALGTAPVGGYLMDRDVRVTANIAGGGGLTVVGTIGPSGDPDQIASAITLNTGTVPASRNGTDGVNPRGRAVAGAPLFLTLTPGTASLTTVNAGSLTIDLLFSKPDSPGY